MQGKELSIPKWGIFSGKCCFLRFFGPSSLTRNLSPNINQETVETQMIPNIKISSKTVELVLQSSLSRRFLCICIHWNWKTTSSLSTHLGKKSRDNKTEALLAIHEVKIASNEQSKKDFAVSFDEIFNEIVVLAEILSTQNSWLKARFSPSKTRNSIKVNEYHVCTSINNCPFTSWLRLFEKNLTKYSFGSHARSTGEIQRKQQNFPIKGFKINFK